jgi:hypothetical protein
MKGNVVKWLDDDDDDDDNDSSSVSTPRAARQERYHQSDDGQTDVVGGVNSRYTLMEIFAGGIAILSIATSAVAMIMVHLARWCMRQVDFHGKVLAYTLTYSSYA